MVATVVSAVPANCVGAVKFPENAPVPVTFNAPVTVAPADRVKLPESVALNKLAVPVAPSIPNDSVLVPLTLE